MSSFVNKFVTALTVLGADVANNGTFTLPYPSGSKQSNFLAGLANANASYMIVNDNDRWTVAGAALSLSYGASLITVTNLTGQTLTQGSKISLMLEQVDGNLVTAIQIPVDLVSVTGNITILNAMAGLPEGTIEYVEFVTTKPVTTAAKLASLNLTINSTDLTGGVVALTSATVTPIGAVIAGSAITAGNKLARGDTLSVKATGVTAFAEGQGFLNVRIRLDNPNAY